MPEWPYDALPPPADWPIVIPYPNTVRTMPLGVLVAAAAIAGSSGFGGPPIDPELTVWAMKLLRKLAWRELHRRRQRHFPWDDMLTARGPHK